ncbi:MAG TPA: YybS family protein [Bacillota bacterium]|nr:YybS family protein [Bacillota bacterium]
MSQSRNQNLRALTEGALLAALTVVLYVADVYTRILIYVVPVPIAILVVKHDLRTGLMAAAVSALGVGLILGLIDSVIVFVRVATLGLTLGVCLAKLLPWPRTIAITSVASTVQIAIDFMLAAVVSKLSPTEFLGSMMDGFAAAGERAVEIYEGMGMGETSMMLARQSVELMTVLLKSFLPVIVLSAAVLGAVIVAAVARWVLVRMNEKVVPVPPFARWQLGWEWIWGLIAGILLSQLGQWMGIELISTIGKNVTMGFALLYTVQGVAIIWHFFTKRNIPKALAVIAIVLIYLTPPFNLLVPIAGVLDTWLDFRNLAAQ